MTNDFWEPDERIGTQDLNAKKKFRDEKKAPPKQETRKVWADETEKRQAATGGVVREIKKGGFLDKLLEKFGKPAD